jgi:hypothetical protein
MSIIQARGSLDQLGGVGPAQTSKTPLEKAQAVDRCFCSCGLAPLALGRTDWSAASDQANDLANARVRGPAKSTICWLLYVDYVRPAG